MKNKKNKKQFIVLFMTIISCFIFTGCKDEIPELSDSDMKMVEEYAAQLLLKYDKNYSSSVLEQEQIDEKMSELEARAQLQEAVKAQKEAQEAAKEEANEEAGNSGSETTEVVAPVYGNIAEFLGYDGLTIDCTNVVIGDSYPRDVAENDWQGVARAGNGNSIVAFEFNVTNNGYEDVYIDMMNAGIKASVKVDGRITKSPLTTLLVNDFMFYKGNLSVGESASIVLLVEMSQNDVEVMESAVLTLKKGDERMETSLL